MKHNYEDFIVMFADCEYEGECLTKLSCDLFVTEVEKDLISNYHESTQKWFEDDLLNNDDPYMVVCTNVSEEGFSSDVIIRKDKIKTGSDVLGIIYDICQYALEQGIPGSITFKTQH